MQSKNNLSGVVQWLVIAASVVVITFGAYFGWMEYRKWQLIWKAEEITKTMKSETLRLERQHEENLLLRKDIEKMSLACNSAVADLRRHKIDTQLSDNQQSLLVSSVKNCISQGAIDYDAIKSFNIIE